jgi:hypothetical protein
MQTSSQVVDKANCMVQSFLFLWPLPCQPYWTFEFEHDIEMILTGERWREVTWMKCKYPNIWRYGILRKHLYLWNSRSRLYTRVINALHRWCKYMLTLVTADRCYTASAAAVCIRDDGAAGRSSYRCVSPISWRVTALAKIRSVALTSDNKPSSLNSFTQPPSPMHWTMVRRRHAVTPRVGRKLSWCRLYNSAVNVTLTCNSTVTLKLGFSM